MWQKKIRGLARGAAEGILEIVQKGVAGFFFVFFFTLNPRKESLLQHPGEKEGGDTGSSAAPCNYCGSRCIVTIFDGLRHRWV